MAKKRIKKEDQEISKERVDVLWQMLDKDKMGLFIHLISFINRPAYIINSQQLNKMYNLK